MRQIALLFLVQPRRTNHFGFPVALNEMKCRSGGEAVIIEPRCKLGRVATVEDPASPCSQLGCGHSSLGPGDNKLDPMALH